MYSLNRGLHTHSRAASLGDSPRQRYRTGVRGGMDVLQDLFVRCLDQFLDSTFVSLDDFKGKRSCHLWLIIVLRMPALTGHLNEWHLPNRSNEGFNTQLFESCISLPLTIRPFLIFCQTLGLRFVCIENTCRYEPIVFGKYNDEWN